MITMGITSRPGFVSPGTQYTPTPMPTSYSVPIGEALPNRPAPKPVYVPGCVDMYGNKTPCLPPPMGGQAAISGSRFTIPDNFFGFLMLIGGI